MFYRRLCWNYVTSLIPGTERGKRQAVGVKGWTTVTSQYCLRPEKCVVIHTLFLQRQFSCRFICGWWIRSACTGSRIISIMTAGLWTEIWTRHLRNTKTACRLFDRHVCLNLTFSLAYFSGYFIAITVSEPVSVSPVSNFSNNWSILTKLGMNCMLLDATTTFYVIISYTSNYNMADKRIYWAVAILAPFTLG
jgi:hypothetical protein